MGFWEDAKSFVGFTEDQVHQEQSMPRRPVVPSQPQKSERPPIIQLPSSARKPSSHSVQTIDQNCSEIVIFEPRVYEDTLAISSHLKSGRPIIVNLKSLDALNGKRLIDFVCGTAYAFDGKMHKIGPNIFLFTPPAVNILDMQEKDLGQELDEESEEHFSDYEHRPFMVDQPVNSRYIDPKYARQTDMFGQQKYG